MNLPAAAIPAGAVVRLRVGVEGTRDLTIKKAFNGTPFAGRVVWQTEEAGNVELGGAARIEVVSLP